ncbi:MAG: hypothetical protein WC613_04770 [Candidatus Aenigmatarchaeota archaeon]
MGEIHIYPVHRATAQVEDGGIVAKLHYDTDSSPVTKRFPANPDFGFSVYDDLIKHGYAKIATESNPLRSPSGGAAYFLENGKVLVHRRDKRAPTHPLQHSISGGFPSCERQTYYPAEIMVAEGAEMVLVTKEKPHRILVSNDDPVARAITLDAANRIGIDTRKPIGTYFLEPIIELPDRVEIYRGNDLVSSTTAYLQFLWEAEAAINALKVYIVEFDPENVIAVDTEGMMKGDDYIHFNRESFVFRPEDISNRRFGDRLDSPVVYKSQKTDEGTIPVLQTEEPQDAPYIFMPDDMLSRILYGTGIWKGSWLEHFRDFHKALIVK